MDDISKIILTAISRSFEKVKPYEIRKLTDDQKVQLEKVIEPYVKTRQDLLVAGAMPYGSKEQESALGTMMDKFMTTYTKGDEG